MAQRHPRLIVFYGTEEERRRWVRERNIDPQSVLLSSNALRSLQGRAGTVETWIASGNDGLSQEESLRLSQQIRLLNNLYGKEPTE